MEGNLDPALDPPSPTHTTSTSNFDPTVKQRTSRIAQHVTDKVRSIADEPLYASPHALFDWGEDQTHALPVWNNLFFDLILVGVAFKLDSMLELGIDGPYFLGTCGLFACIFSATEGMWMLKMQYDSRIGSNDLFHKGFMFVQGVIFAVAALAIDALEVMGNPDLPNALTFSAAFFLYHFLDSLMYVELGYCSPSMTRSNAVRSGRTQVRRSVLSVFIAAVSVATAATGQSLIVTASMWLLPTIVSRVQLYVMIALKLFSPKNSIPMHIAFTIHRYGEFQMLMLGESIISLIVVPMERSANFIATFVFSYLLVAVINLLHFSTMPHDPNHNALRRSSLRGVMWIFQQNVLGMMLIAVGAGFKLVLKNSAAVPIEAVWLLCASVSIVLCSILFGRTLHSGLHEEILVLRGNQLWTKIGLWTCKLFTALIILVGPAMHAPAWGLLVFCFGATLLTFIIQTLDLRLFKEHHMDRIEHEVQERKKRYALEKLTAEEAKKKTEQDAQERLQTEVEEDAVVAE